MEDYNAYIAQEQTIAFLNGKACIQLAFVVILDDDDETVFDFSGYISSYFRVYNEEGGQLLKNLSPNLSRSSNVLILNANSSDMTFEDIGTYYYELGYNMNGYEIPLMFGKFKVE